MKRILLKISGEAIGAEDGGWDTHVLDSLVEQLKTAVAQGAQFGLVVGGGNLFRGSFGETMGFGRVAGDFVGMLATLMNGVAIADYFTRAGLESLVMTPHDMPEYVERFNASKAVSYLEAGKIVVFAGGTGHPYFTTDTTAALRACEIKADVLIKATKVDGIYDKDPMKHDDAVLFQTLSYSDVLGQQLKVMDLPAVSLCSQNSVPLRVLNIFEKGNITRMLSGEHVGTLVS